MEIAKVIYVASPTISQSVMSQMESTVTVSGLYWIMMTRTRVRLIQILNWGLGSFSFWSFRRPDRNKGSFIIVGSVLFVSTMSNISISRISLTGGLKHTRKGVVGILDIRVLSTVTQCKFIICKLCNLNMLHLKMHLILNPLQKQIILD